MYMHRHVYICIYMHIYLQIYLLIHTHTPRVREGRSTTGVETEQWQKPSRVPHAHSIFHQRF